jgi:hypothetical protein
VRCVCTRLAFLYLKKCREPGNAKFRALSFQPLDNFCQHLPGALSEDLKTLGVQVYHLSITMLCQKNRPAPLNVSVCSSEKNDKHVGHILVSGNYSMYQGFSSLTVSLWFSRQNQNPLYLLYGTVLGRAGQDYLATSLIKSSRFTNLTMTSS